MTDFITDKSFDRSFVFQKAEYDNCRFEHCDFSERDLSGTLFSDCEFIDCNFAMAKISQTAFREVVFRGCKLLGLHFDHCDAFLFGATFENCQLNLASFYRMKLRKIRFTDCQLREVDFSQADLAMSRFENCDLLGAIFDNTILEKSDLRTAYHYRIDPETNHIGKAKFSLSGLPGLLQRYGIEVEN